MRKLKIGGIKWDDNWDDIWNKRKCYPLLKGKYWDWVTIVSEGEF